MNVFYQNWPEVAGPDRQNSASVCNTGNFTMTSIDIPKCYPLPPLNIDP